MGYKTIGGGNLTELFALGSDWSLGTNLMDLNKNFTTVIAGHEKSKNLEATITHEIFDETYTDLLDDYLSETADTANENYEDGSSNVDTTSLTDANNLKVLLAICYSGRSNESTKQRFVRVFPCQLQGGGYTMESEKTIRPETKLVAVKADVAITVAASAFNTSLVSSAATVTIAAGSYGLSTWLTAVPTT